MNKLFILLISLLTITYSCKDSETFLPDPAENSFKASAFVEVVDINGNPVPDVSVSIVHTSSTGLVSTTYGATNDDGVFLLKNVDMYTSTFVRVAKSGYFHGSRRFYPAAGKNHTLHIMLLDEQYIGSVQSASGGTLNVNDKVTLNFPANGIVTSNGQPFSGEVRVTAQPIAADDENLSDKMPGNLVGINEAGDKGALGSMGMVAVELTSTSGDLLQLKSGSTVEMKMKVPNSKMNTAPSTIPMWYFDESAGYWKEEGTASLIGTEYVAQLPHFSFWNCDAWFELTKWGATFVFENGEPASQVNVCLNIISMNSGSCAITNEDGFVCGAIPVNEVLLLEVRNPCGEILYSQQVGPYSDTTMIGPITIQGTTVDLTTVSGIALDCNGAAVADGFVKINVGNAKYYTGIYAGGIFSFTALVCDQTDVNVTAYDVTALKQSLTSTFPFASNIDAGTLTVCENLTELVDVEVVGLPDHVLYYFPETYVEGNKTTIYTADSTQNFKYFYLRVNATTTGTYLAETSEIGFDLPNGDRAFATGVTVTFTYYGALGDYITGTVTGTFHTGPNGQGGPDYPLAASFTVLRE